MMNLFNLIREICFFFESCSYLYFSFGIFVNFYDFFLFTIEVTVLSKLSCVRNKSLVLPTLVLLWIFTRFVVCINSPKTENQKIHKVMSSLFIEHAASKPKHKVTIKTTRSTSCGFSVFTDCFDQSQVSLLQATSFFLPNQKLAKQPSNSNYLRDFKPL